MRPHQIASAIFALMLIGGGSMELAHGASAKDTIVGVALSPAHFPNFSDHDFDIFFEQAAQIGSHVTWIFEWESLTPMLSLHVIHDKATKKGLKLHLDLSPLALFGGRKNPAVSKSVGGNSFGDPIVRRAYIDAVLEIAALRPDYLGLATEVNLLAQNPSEFASFASLAHEAYAAVKKKYPEQTVTLSFQWEMMRAHQQFDMCCGNSRTASTFTHSPAIPMPSVILPKRTYPATTIHPCASIFRRSASGFPKSDGVPRRRATKQVRRLFSRGFPSARRAQGSSS